MHSIAAALPVCAFALSTFVASARRIALQNQLALNFSHPLAITAIALAGGSLVAASFHEQGLAAAAAGIALAAAATCTITDTQTGYVFDCVTVPAFAAVLFVSILDHSVVSRLEGAAAAGGALALLYVLTQGRGLGLGDVKLACCTGAGLGVSTALPSIGLAFEIGGVYAAFALLSGRARRGDAVAFAPYLYAGMAGMLILGGR